MTKRQIIDIHAYIGSDYHTYFHQSGPYSVERYSSLMDTFKISHSVLTPGGYGREIQENEGIIRKSIQTFPERFSGLHRANPREKDTAHMVESSIRIGMKGIMLHPHWDTFVANSKLVDPIMEVAQSFKVPVLFYCGDIPYTMPGQIADMAIKYSDVPVIIGHMAKTEIYQHVVQSALRSPNIFVETSGCNIIPIIEDAISKLGPERVLFGSGWPGMSIPAEICKIDSLNISDNHKDLIFAINAIRLFQLNSLVPSIGGKN